MMASLKRTLIAALRTALEAHLNREALLHGGPVTLLIEMSSSGHKDRITSGQATEQKWIGSQIYRDTRQLQNLSRFRMF
jgi:hypothetical protein